MPLCAPVRKDIGVGLPKPLQHMEGVVRGLPHARWKEARVCRRADARGRDRPGYHACLGERASESALEPNARRAACRDGLPDARETQRTRARARKRSPDSGQIARRQPPVRSCARRAICLPPRAASRGRFRCRRDGRPYCRSEHRRRIGSFSSLLHIRESDTAASPRAAGKLAGETFHEGVMHPRPCAVRKHQQPAGIVRTKQQRLDVAHRVRHPHGQ